ncbi:MAG: hypothetical protein Q4G49_13945 [Paracoccus sp. (in: a-proteobacteria)]|nr:hypothetical protein [Paracoccus sp. (in: a-proteobacteria)]
MRFVLAALTIAVLPACALAADDHDHHLAEADGLRVLHVWTPTRDAGEVALIYLEIENRSGANTVLTGGKTMRQPLDVVGFQYGSGGENWIVLPALPVASGARLVLKPRAMARRPIRLPQMLTAGQWRTAMRGAMRGMRIRGTVAGGQPPDLRWRSPPGIFMDRRCLCAGLSRAGLSAGGGAPPSMREPAPAAGSG